MPNGIETGSSFGSSDGDDRISILEDVNESGTTLHPAPPSPSARTPSGAAPSRKKRWSIWVAAILILCGGGFLLSQRTSNNPAPSGGKRGGKKGLGGPVPVAVAKATKGNIGEYVNALGTVTPVYTVTITSRVVGQLTEVLYKEGQIVHKGDLLAVVDPRPYMAALTQAQGQLARDQAMLKNAFVDLNRYQTAFSQHAIPEQTLNTQQATVEGAKGTVKLDEGSLEAAQVNVDYTKITSPIDGRVGLRTVDPGNIVPANGTTGIATITQLQPITVIFTMAEDYIGQVIQQLGHGQQLKVLALDRSNERQIAEGVLLTLDNQVDPTTGTVKVRASFANRKYELFPNEFVNARLLVRTLSGVNLLPTAAIQRNNEQAFVYVVNTQNNTVKIRNINITTINGDMAAETGVTPGETLVTDGFDRLTDGAHIRIRTSPDEATDQDDATGSSEASPSQAPPSPMGGNATGKKAGTRTAQPNESESDQAQQGAADQQVNTNQENPQQGKRK